MYEVGLRVVEQYDYARTYIAVDGEGKPRAGEVARPILTLIWYPASKTTSSVRVTYGDYLKLAAKKDDFAPSAALVASVAKEDGSDYKASQSQPMWASVDAEPAKGKFPVVIYAPSFGNYPFENADLCEYLASHGYLVISSPSLGVRGKEMTSDLPGIYAQAADIGFLIGYAHTLPQADLSEVAVSGFSWGGISNLFAAARDTRIRALVSLDGSARYFPKLVHDSLDVKPGQISLPVLFFEQELSAENMMKYKIDMSSSVLNDLRFSDLTVVHMHAMHHADFGSLQQRSAEYQASREPTDYTAREAWESYEWVCRYALEFLDSVLKHDAEAAAFIKNTAGQNHVPNHLLSVEHNPSQGTPATFEQFRVQLSQKGFDHAQEVYAKFKAQDGDWKLTDGEIGSWADGLADDAHYAEATEVAKLGISLYPDESGMYAQLADVYDRSGQTQAAIDSYKKALEKDPNDEGVKKKLKELAARTK
jgi:dienelactone hydrolase